MHHLHGQPLPQNSFLQIKQVHILSKVKASKFACPPNSNIDECGMGGKFSAVSAENAPPPQNTTYERTGNSCTRKSWEQTLLTIPRLTLTITINAKPCYYILDMNFAHVCCTPPLSLHTQKRRARTLCSRLTQRNSRPKNIQCP